MAGLDGCDDTALLGLLRTLLGLLGAALGELTTGLDGRDDTALLGLLRTLLGELARSDEGEGEGEGEGAAAAAALNVPRDANHERLAPLVVKSAVSLAVVATILYCDR